MDIKLSAYNWRKLLMDNYTILDNVDFGSFGEVHTLQKHHNDTVYAVKAIKACGFVTEDEYILAEIRSLLQLKHPHIINMHDVILDDHIVCIIMEYAPYGNLEKFILKNKPVSQKFIMMSFQQVLSAVVFCHSNDIAHKDINPSNILIFNDRCVKLADFGLAVKCHDACGNLVLCEDYLGQNSYLAPEVLQHKPHCGMKTDVWSLGCLLYFSLCGKPPFEGDAKDIVLHQNTKGIKFPNCFKNAMCKKDAMCKMARSLCRVVPEERMKSPVALEYWQNILDAVK